MKKEYIYPEMEVVNVQTISTILSGSTGAKDEDADKDNEGFFMVEFPRGNNPTSKETEGTKDYLVLFVFLDVRNDKSP